MLFFSREKKKLDEIFKILKELHEFLHKREAKIFDKDEKIGDYIDDKFYFGEIVKCEKCKCLLYRSDAIVEKAEIRYRKTLISDHPIGLAYKEVPYVYEPVYCLKCWEEVKRKKK